MWSSSSDYIDEGSRLLFTPTTKNTWIGLNGRAHSSITTAQASGLCHVRCRTIGRPMPVNRDVLQITGSSGPGTLFITVVPLASSSSQELSFHFSVLVDTAGGDESNADGNSDNGSNNGDPTESLGTDAEPPV